MHAQIRKRHVLGITLVMQQEQKQYFQPKWKQKNFLARKEKTIAYEFFDRADFVEDKKTLVLPNFYPCFVYMASNKMSKQVSFS